MMGMAERSRSGANWRNNSTAVVGRGQLGDLGMTSEAVRHAVESGQIAMAARRGSCGRRVGRTRPPAGDGGSARRVAMPPWPLASAVALWGVPGLAARAGARPHRPSTRTGASPHLGIVHSTLRLDPAHVTVVDGIPVTTPARTLLDLSLRLRAPQARGPLRRPAPPPVHAAAVVACPRRRSARIRWAGRLGPPAPARRRPTEGYQPTGSKLERRFEEILERAGERPFERQVDLGDDEGWIGRVDFADRRLKVIVEVQSETFHSSLSDRRRDAERFRRLRAAGWIVVEVTEDEIFRPAAARARAGAIGPGVRPSQAA